MKQLYPSALLLVLINILCVAYSVIQGQLLSPEIGGLTAISTILFVFVLIFASRSERNLFIALPFVFLAFPSVVNDFFPSCVMGLPNELGSTSFPIFTHIDVFLLLMVVLTRRKSIIYSSVPRYIPWAVFLFLCSSIVNIIGADTDQEIGLIGCGLYIPRYVILTLLLTFRFDVNKNLSNITIGVCVSIFFLLLESSVNTYLKSLPSLTSGSLGANSFGNITGQVFVFLSVFLFVRNRNGMKIFPYSGLIVIALFTCMLIVVLSNTRMALLGLVLNAIVVYRMVFSKRARALIYVLLVAAIILAYQFVDTDRYNIDNITSNIEFNQSNNDIFKNIDIQYSTATTSLMTRLQLFETSVKMIEDSPFFGVGFVNFNLLKYKYGFDIFVLIDPHNGYLFFLSQLGIVGLLWIWFIYVRPIILFFRLRHSKIRYLAIVNMGMAFCDFTNAGVFKMSIVSLLIFISIALELSFYKIKEQTTLRPSQLTP